MASHYSDIYNISGGEYIVTFNVDEIVISNINTLPDSILGGDKCGIGLAYIINEIVKCPFSSKQDHNLYVCLMTNDKYCNGQFISLDPKKNNMSFRCENAFRKPKDDEKLIFG